MVIINTIVKKNPTKNPRVTKDIFLTSLHWVSCWKYVTVFTLNMTITWQSKSLHAHDNLAMFSEALVSIFRCPAYPQTLTQEAIAFQKYAYVQPLDTVKYTSALFFSLLLFSLTGILVLNIRGKWTLKWFYYNIVCILTEIWKYNSIHCLPQDFFS